MAMLKTIEGANLSGKKVILRADLDVPIAEGEVKDDYRLQALLPTLKYLLGRKAKVLLLVTLVVQKARGVSSFL